MLGLALSYKDRLLVFRWVLVVLPLWLVCFCFAMKEISWRLFLTLNRLKLLRHLSLHLDIWTTFWILTILALGAWSVVFVRLGCGWTGLMPLMPGPHFWICVCLFQADLFRLEFVVGAVALVLVWWIFHFWMVAFPVLPLAGFVFLGLFGLLGCLVVWLVSVPVVGV